MFGGTVSIQTKRGEDFLTLLAKAWGHRVTGTPGMREGTWLKKKTQNKLIQSLIIWPIDPNTLLIRP